MAPLNHRVRRITVVIRTRLQQISDSELNRVTQHQQPICSCDSSNLHNSHGHDGHHAGSPGSAPDRHSSNGITRDDVETTPETGTTLDHVLWTRCAASSATTSAAATISAPATPATDLTASAYRRCNRPNQRTGATYPHRGSHYGHKRDRSPHAG
jgi:hypothetical protein